MKFHFANMAKPVSWEERFQQLVKFKEENGHCQVQEYSYSWSMGETAAQGVPVFCAG
jgi:hypothetical protein